MVNLWKHTAMNCGEHRCQNKQQKSQVIKIAHFSLSVGLGTVELKFYFGIICF
jgi:hypothetical protein